MLLRVSKFLEKVSFKLKQKSLYFELKHYIKNGENHFIAAYKYNRGIGKSFTLLQLAHKYKCPILVGNYSSAEHLLRMDLDSPKKPVKIIVINNDCRGRRLDLALCEEGIEEKLIHEIILPMCKQVIGFKKQY